MPYICPKTGEIALKGLENPEVTVETSPKSLVSHTKVRGASDVTHTAEEWVWKEESDLTPEERAKYARLKAAAEHDKK